MTKRKAIISLILPIYNVEKYIKDCILSIVAQPNFKSDCELIIVNDGTLDKSMQIAFKLTKDLNNVKYVDKENGGLSSARNYGMKEAEGKYLWFFDSDDFMPDLTISVLLDVIKSKQSIDVIHFNYEYNDGSLPGIKCKSKENFIYSGIDFLDDNAIQKSAQYYLFKNSFLKKNKFLFKEKLLHEDELFTPIVLAKAKSIIYFNRVCYIYNVRDGSITTSITNLKDRIESLVYIFKKFIYEAKAANDKRLQKIFFKHAIQAYGAIYFYNKQTKFKYGWVSNNVNYIHILTASFFSLKYKYILAFLHITFHVYKLYIFRFLKNSFRPE